MIYWCRAVETPSSSGPTLSTRRRLLRASPSAVGTSSKWWTPCTMASSATGWRSVWTRTSSCWRRASSPTRAGRTISLTKLTKAWHVLLLLKCLESKAHRFNAALPGCLHVSLHFFLFCLLWQQYLVAIISPAATPLLWFCPDHRPAACYLKRPDVTSDVCPARISHPSSPHPFISCLLLSYQRSLMLPSLTSLPPPHYTCFVCTQRFLGWNCLDCETVSLDAAKIRSQLQFHLCLGRPDQDGI